MLMGEYVIDITDKNTTITLYAQWIKSIFVNIDINGDGKISAVDLAYLNTMLSDYRALKNEKMLDVNGDGRVTALDLSILRIIMLNV